MIKNEAGFITQLENFDWDVNTGDSICNDCEKIMPICWDSICAICGKTFCYNHVRIINGFWVCWDHEPTGRR